MTSFFVSYRQSQIHYLQWGFGKEYLLCLHGFGESAASFAGLAEQLKEKYTIIALDMPLHGKTVWNEGLLCTITDIRDIIEKIPGIAGNSFFLAGFSMGGRVALGLYEEIPQRIRRLILLAPDGLKMNFWYWLATQTFYGNRLLRYFMDKPRIFFIGTRALKKIRLINMGIYNYVHQYLKAEEKREQLYAIWTTMRKIRPDVGVIKTLIRNNNTQVLLIYGRYDRVIRPVTGMRLKKGIVPYCKLRVLHCGHRLLQEKNLPVIAGLMC
ncbi:MAG: alpha/beta hydrolase [Chitinophagaceae bacterium]|nr:alpha/beta hydrolase [Chitinophagaceae bacterium]